MRFYTGLSVFGCFLFFYSSKVVAQESSEKKYYQPIQDVFQTELVHPQEKNEVQLTFNPVFGKNDGGSYLNLPMLAEYGLTDRWQVELLWNTLQTQFPENGTAYSEIGDLEVGTQYSFMNIANTNFHAALGFELEIPLSHEEGPADNNEWEYEPYVSVALDLPELNNAQLFAQTGVGFVRNKEEDKGLESEEYSVSGGFFIPINKLVFTSELTVYSGKSDSGRENRFYLTPGAVFNLPGAWEAGVAVPLGLNKRSDEFMVLAILTYEFSLGKEDE